MITMARGEDGEEDSPDPQTPSQDVSVEEENPPFPVDELMRLDDMIARIRWVVPVLPRGELETLLTACIYLSERKVDHKSEPCQKFIKEGLTISFTRILTDEAVSGWKFDIHRAILRNCERLIDLCVVKLLDDSYPLLDLLAMTFNPTSKFQVFNSSRTAESLQDEEIFANPPDSRTPRGWLVDLVNRFGRQGGFERLAERFQREDSLSVPLIFALLRPFGNCCEYLTAATIRKYLMPLVERIPKYLESLTDDELKKEAKLNVDIKNDALSSIVKWLRAFVLKLPSFPGQEETAKNLEMFRLKMILRLLEISSFNGKMNALNELNKVIASISFPRADDDEWLTTDKMARWIEENGVLKIILRDSLHQPQYVEKLEKIVRFAIKERAVTMEDLDTIWAAQIGKHEAIVKNVHDLLAKLAWDFSPEQLDHLFECFQASWSHANKKQREKLLELIRRLAEDDKEGVMATKVLGLLWNLAHSDDVPTEIMDQALTAHTTILDYSCSQDRDSQKTYWLERCVAEIKHGRWVIPTLKQIREICCLYTEAYGAGGVSAGGHVGQLYQKQPQSTPRHEVITNLQTSHSLVVEVADNLDKYMQEGRRYVAEHPEITDTTQYVPDGRYNHNEQVSERLNFLRFLLKDGQLWLSEPQAKQIWRSLAQEGLFPSDREACFRWFSKLMGDEPDLDPEINRNFFESVILQFDPTLLTESGMRCFERFFKSVNAKEQKLVVKRRGHQMNDYDLIGMDYIWRVILNSGDEIANRAIELLRDVHTNIGPKLQQAQLHEDFINSCMDRLRALYDTVSLLSKDQVHMEVVRICRVLKVLTEYIVHCDYDYAEERVYPPLARAYRGKAVTMIVRFQSQGGRGMEDVDIWTHSNDTLGAVRRQIYARLKLAPAHTRIELYHNGDLLDHVDDKKLISQIPLRDKTHLTGKIVSATAMPSSPDSSSDSSGGGVGASTSPQHLVQGSPPQDGAAQNPLAEKTLPGFRMSQKREWTEFLFKLWDLGAGLDHPLLKNSARDLLRLIPADQSIKEELIATCARIAEQNSPDTNLDEVYFGKSPSQALYYMEVTYALLVPAAMHLRPVLDKAGEFQRVFIQAGGAKTVLRMLTDMKFMTGADGETDSATLKAAFLAVARLAKLVLTTVTAAVVVSAMLTPMTDTPARLRCERLRQASAVIPSLTADVMIRQGTENEQERTLQYTVGSIVPHLLRMQAGYTSCSINQAATDLGQAMTEHASRTLPGDDVIVSLMKLSWCAAYGRIDKFQSATEEDLKSFQKEYQSLVTHSISQLQLAGGDDASATLDLSGPDLEDLCLCRESLETLTVAVALRPQFLDILICEKEIWQHFVIDMLLLAPTKLVRTAAAEQMALMAMRCCGEEALMKFIQPVLFSVLHTPAVTTHDGISHEYFNLLCRLLNYASTSKIIIPNVEELLEREMGWLRDARRTMMKTGVKPVSDTLLEGHLNVARELFGFLSPDRKAEIGLLVVDPEDEALVTEESDGTTVELPEMCLVRDLLDNFLFPATRQLMAVRGRERNTPELTRGKLTTPVCNTRSTCIAAYDLLVSLATGCVQNFQAVSQLLTDMFYADESLESIIHEWEFSLPVGPRSSKGFVGLKNAGATCYMNSVMQQLFMIEPVRLGILSAEGAVTDPDEDFSGEDSLRLNGDGVAAITEEETSFDRRGQSQINDYNIGILKQIQAIFGHLAASRLQYYVPRGLWRHFRINGEPVNLREQHDAVEFYNSLVESLDEALKALSQDQVMCKVLGGSYADQIICRGCPHRYSREAGFTVLIIDIRNHSNIHDSLENYVKGELLEGANAYYCEKCDKKVDTVKRMCIKKLPRILTIQLKRFDYDWERECPVKFNDYFEFSRELDMEPYTVKGLAKLDGDVIQDEEDILRGGDEETPDCYRYKLTGIVVHSGQASGGHYYSYILHGTTPANAKWYKFDDGEVSECSMHEEDELKTQCFGGEYMGEVFDHMNKRMNCRRQKRWWNAYILFYTRLDEYKKMFATSDKRQQMNLQNQTYQSHYQGGARRSSGVEATVGAGGDDLDSLSRTFAEMTFSESAAGFPKMPAPIERSVKLGNMRFVHNLSQFQPEYFMFMKRLLSCNLPIPAPIPGGQSGEYALLRKISNPNDMDDAMQATVELGCRFLTKVGFRTKKAIRGHANDWQEIVSVALKHSRRARAYFVYKVLFTPSLKRRNIFSEFILECPTNEVRTAVSKMVAIVAHHCLVTDGDQIIHTVKARVASITAGTSAEEVPAVLAELAETNHDIGPMNLTGERTNRLILMACMNLLEKEVPEHGRHLAQYFGLFHFYAHMGAKDKMQLLKLDVPYQFMLVAINEGPGPAIKYQYAELGKLYSVVSLLVRCCDVSSRCQSSKQGEGVKPLRNPFGELPEPLMQIQPNVAELLFVKQQYVKKIIEDAHGLEDTIRLIRFASWENASFSSTVLTELLWQIAYSYTCEMRPFLDLLLAVLLMEDSWQSHRIHNALRGVSEEREGLFDTIHRAKSHFQKRAYHCIKCLVQLFSSCQLALEMLHANGDLKRKWSSAVSWLQDELERRPGYGGGAQYSYSTWSPPAQSNETSTAYYVERSASARVLLEKAREISPDDGPEADDQNQDEGISDSHGGSVGGVGMGAVQVVSGVIRPNVDDDDEDDEDEEHEGIFDSGPPLLIVDAPPTSADIVHPTPAPASIIGDKLSMYSAGDNSGQVTRVQSVTGSGGTVTNPIPAVATVSPLSSSINNNNNNNNENNNVGTVMLERHPQIRHISITVENSDGSTRVVSSTDPVDPPPSPTNPSDNGPPPPPAPSSLTK